ncbi:unnamed protein product [Cylindrotheca closterium]|uniref:Fe2OG dioxygenase domain-containing protein n=1 Tax=Cylindrotheca closterium TaxID=2856 RepID=A0AAD2JGE3_9STRA|nr:unnamed protein product [Cylindrotheca closterium]
MMIIQLPFAPTSLAYREKDEEIPDWDLTAKLWELVDQMDFLNQEHPPSIPFSERTKKGSFGFYFPSLEAQNCQADGDKGQCPSTDSSDDEDDEEEEECVDKHELCEKLAQLGECLYVESDDCPKSCLTCKNPPADDDSATTYSIGRKQTMSKDFLSGVREDIEEVKEEWESFSGDLSVLNLEMPVETDEELVEAVAKQIIGTQEYMANVVMVDPEYEDVRRSCQNYLGHCEIYAAIGYCENNFMGGEDFLMMRQKCAPACRACDDYELLQPCLANFDHNFYHEGELDTLFRRMVGELDISKSDLPYKPSIHARPGGQSKADYLAENGTISSNEPVDGAWLVTLEDFLTPEECDRFIELGALEGYSRSGLQEGEDKKKHRTSVNAWCSAKHCDKDPIAQSVVQRISETTGMPSGYSEPLQLLKYTEGQYYKMHHDVDLPLETSWPQGPRVLTFFLYLNEVEEGGATRMVDITHKNDAYAPGDLLDECVKEANTTAAKAACALIEMDIKPKRGMALVWPNVNDNDMMQKESGTWHEALPVIKGVKYGANAWFRLRRFDRECDTKAYETWLESHNMTYTSDDDDDDDDEAVLSMETLHGGANSTTTVQSKKEKMEQGDATTITTTTTTVSTTPTTVTTTTTKVITTTTVTPVAELENDSSDDSEDDEWVDGSVS